MLLKKLRDNQDHNNRYNAS